MSTTTRTIDLDVTGMTCGHCVSSVTEELTNLPEVNDVSIVLEPKGTSVVTVVGAQSLDVDALRKAIDEAGYEVTGVRPTDGSTID